MFLKSRERVYASTSIFARPLATALRTAGHLRRFILNPQWRSETLTRLSHPRSHLQGATYTEADRYPDLFAICRDQLHNHPAPRILSFGCSTGEEVFTLARYLPHAEIVGVDINRWCLRQARAATAVGASQFFLHPDDEEFAALPSFDAIFCLAVLQRSENRTNSEATAHPGFPFRRFSEQLATLDRKLNAGGLLFLDNADFSLLDTSLAHRYQPLAVQGNRVFRERPLFGPDDQLRCREYWTDRCFVKLR